MPLTGMTLAKSYCTPNNLLSDLCVSFNLTAFPNIEEFEEYLDKRATQNNHEGKLLLSMLTQGIYLNFWSGNAGWDEYTKVQSKTDSFRYK